MKFILDIILFIGYALCSGIGLVILKTAMNNKFLKDLNYIETFFQVRFILGFLLYACGFLLWMVILSKYKLNIAFPIAISLFFIVSGLGSYFILRESFTLLQFVGIALCFFGILLINIK
mgnify:CR=1 FL=1